MVFEGLGTFCYSSYSVHSSTLEPCLQLSLPAGVPAADSSHQSTGTSVHFWQLHGSSCACRAWWSPWEHTHSKREYEHWQEVAEALFLFRCGLTLLAESRGPAPTELLWMQMHQILLTVHQGEDYVSGSEWNTFLNYHFKYLANEIYPWLTLACKRRQSTQLYLT